MKELAKLLKNSLRLNLLLMFVLLLTSCGRSAPETNVERCLVDISNQQCLCHKYEINKKYIGRVGETYEKPFIYCNKLVGFNPNNWWELRMYLGRVQSYLTKKYNELEASEDYY